METNLTWTSIATLITLMVVAGAIPSMSVLTVAARSAAFGFFHGLLTTLGIIAGDIIFIIIAIYGLSLISEFMGHHFFWVKYLGGAYLIWLGVLLWRSKSKTDYVKTGKQATLLSSFMPGLLITLGDQKAILFYLGFFPSFFDLASITILDTGIIIAIAAISICVTKLSYAYMANRARSILNAKVRNYINRLAGSTLIVFGIVFMVRTQA